MIGIIITRRSSTEFPPKYSMRRITSSSVTIHIEQQLKSYLNVNMYQRIQKDKMHPWDNFAGLWVEESTTNDSDDTEAVAAFMRRTEGEIH